MADKYEQILRNLQDLEEEKLAEADAAYQDAAAWLRDAFQSVLEKVKLLPKHRLTRNAQRATKAAPAPRKGRGKRAPPMALETVMEEEELEEDAEGKSQLHTAADVHKPQEASKTTHEEDAAMFRKGRSTRSRAMAKPAGEVAEPANVPVRATRSRVAAKAATLADSFPSPPKGRRTRAKKAKKDSLQLAMIDEIEEHCQPVCLANIELAEKGEAKQAVLPEGEPPCLQIEAQSDDRGGPARDEEDPEKENVQPQIEFLGSSKALAGHQDAPVPEIAAVSDPNRRCSNHLSPEAAVQQTDRGATDDSPDNVAREEASGSLHTAGAQVEGPPPDAAEASAVHNDLTEYFTPAQAELPRASPKSRPTTRSRAKQAAKLRLQATPATDPSQLPQICPPAQVDNSQMHQNALYDSQFMTPTVAGSILQTYEVAGVQNGPLREPRLEDVSMTGLAAVPTAAGPLPSGGQGPQNQDDSARRPMGEGTDLQSGDISGEHGAAVFQDAASEPKPEQHETQQAIAGRSDGGNQSSSLSTHKDMPAGEDDSAKDKPSQPHIGGFDATSKSSVSEEKAMEQHHQDNDDLADEQNLELDESTNEAEALQRATLVPSDLQELHETQDISQPRPEPAPAQNLVTTFRSLLPSRTQPQTTFAAGKKAGEVDAIKAAEAAKRKEAAREAARQQQKEALKKQKAERMKHAQQVKANQEEGQRKAAEEARRREEAAKRKEEEAAARRRAREELERREKEEKQRRIEEAKLKRRQEDLRKQEEASKKRAREAEPKQAPRQPLQEQNDNKRPKVAEYFAKAAALIGPQKSVPQPRDPPYDTSSQKLPAQQHNVTSATASQGLQQKKDPFGVMAPIPGGLESIQIAPYRSEGETSDEEDDQEIPAWAQAGNLRRQIIAQQRLDPDELFQQHEKTCPLNEVFSSIRGQEEAKRDLTRRTSTGNWLDDRVTWKEEMNYKKAMGYL